MATQPDTDYRISVKCPACGHEFHAWYSHIVKGLTHCPDCDTEITEAQVIMGDA